MEQDRNNRLNIQAQKKCPTKYAEPSLRISAGAMLITVFKPGIFQSIDVFSINVKTFLLLFTSYTPHRPGARYLKDSYFSTHPVKDCPGNFDNKQGV